MRTKYITLSSGAKIVYRKYRGGGNATAFNAGFMCGAEYLKNGLPHLFEHMLFNGTDKYTGQEINFRARDRMWINATTSRQTMTVSAYFSNRRLKDAMDFTSNLLLHSTFPKNYIKSEVMVVKEERERAKSNHKKDINFQHRNFMSCEYKNIDQYVNYWFGTDSFLNKVTTKDFKDFQREHYVQNKFIFITSTTLPLGKIKRYVKKYFLSHIPEEPKKEVQPPILRPVIAKPGILKIEDDRETYTARFTIKCDVEGEDVFKKLINNYDSSIIARNLMTQSDLYHNRLRDAGLVYSASCRPLLIRPNQTGIEFDFETSSLDNLDPIFNIIGESIEKLKEGAISQKEIKNFQENWDIENDYPTPSKDNKAVCMNILQAYETYREDNPIDDLSDKKREKFMKQSTVESVKNTIEQIFNENNDCYFTIKGKFEGKRLKNISYYKNLALKTKK